MLYLLLAIISFLVGFFFGGLGVAARAGLLEEVEKEPDKPFEHLSNRTTQFIEPISPKEAFDKSKTIEDFIEKL